MKSTSAERGVDFNITGLVLANSDGKEEDKDGWLCQPWNLSLFQDFFNYSVLCYLFMYLLSKNILTS